MLNTYKFIVILAHNNDTYRFHTSDFQWLLDAGVLTDITTKQEGLNTEQQSKNTSLKLLVSLAVAKENWSFGKLNW